MLIDLIAYVRDTVQNLVINDCRLPLWALSKGHKGMLLTIAVGCAKITLI